jgi:hypothetical protein
MNELNNTENTEYDRLSHDQEHEYACEPSDCKMCQGYNFWELNLLDAICRNCQASLEKN